jgi:hypothetical protein
MNYKTKLKELARGNEDYAKFNARIVNSKKSLLGARLPALRELAKELVREFSDAAKAETTANLTTSLRAFLSSVDQNILEETMLAGLMIDYAKIPDADKIALFREWLPMVDSWAEIDSATPRLKTARAKALWWAFVDECLASSHEFTVRFGVIFMMTNFLNNPDELPQVFARLRRVKHEAYYVKMGVAWLYSAAALKDYDATMREMRDFQLDLWTRRKALTKMLESYRVNPDQKAEIRALRDELSAK